jgi:TIR domain
MDVILSWSGSQSRKVAETLHDWLKDVLPGIKPWISSEDITKGSAWFPALLGRLEAARLCIICITPENVRSPWLYFEAGAIAGKSTDARVCSYLIGVDGGQLTSGPLGQFQWTIAEKADTWKLVRDINRHLQSGAHNELLLQGNFDQKWPQLKKMLDAVLAEYKDAPVREVPSSESLRYQLSPEAIQILLEAAADPDGSVLMVRTFEGLHVQAGRKPLATLRDGRSTAIWQGAVRQLLQNRLLEGRGKKGEVFSVTAEGYRVADELRAQGIGTTQEQSAEPVTGVPAPAHAS